MHSYDRDCFVEPLACTPNADCIRPVSVPCTSFSTITALSNVTLEASCSHGIPALFASAPNLLWLQDRGARRLKRDPASILQLNIGLFCNQACSHCHVESSPLRTEMMDRPTAERCITLLKQSGCTIKTVDLTGGAPELNSQFR